MTELTQQSISRAIEAGYLMIGSIADHLGSTPRAVSMYLREAKLEWLVPNHTVDIHAIRKYCKGRSTVPTLGQISTAMYRGGRKVFARDVGKCIKANGETIESLCRDDAPKPVRRSVIIPATRQEPNRWPERERADMIRAGMQNDRFRPLVMRHTG
jgi:hypothetical protein